MKVEDAVKHFGSQTNLAKALGKTDAAISKWKERGGLVPLFTALRINRMTDGAVDIGLKDYQ